VPAKGHWVDLSSGQERQHQGAHAGQEDHDAGLGDVLADAGMFPASAPPTISTSAAGTAILMLTTDASRAMPSQMAAT